MGNQPSAIQLVPGPGFRKIKANQIPGYEKYDFGAYEIWGPYKKTIVPGPFSGSTVWKDSPIGRLVDGAYVYDMCSVSEGKIRDGIGLRSTSSFSTVPDLGTNKPACIADNMTLANKDDGLFYIHYKHPVFARIMRSPQVSSGFSGIIPTLWAASQLEKGKIPNIKRPAPTSLQNVAEIGYLAYKAKNIKTSGSSLPNAIIGPLDQAVNLLNRSSAIFNMGQSRVLRGGSVPNRAGNQTLLRIGRKTRKSKKLNRK